MKERRIALLCGLHPLKEMPQHSGDSCCNDETQYDVPIPESIAL